MAEVLITVSGAIPANVEEQARAGLRPRADYVELARASGGDLIDHARARNAGPLARWIARLAGPNAALAWACWRTRGRYRVILTDGEQVGIPLALLLKFLGRGPRAVRHVMIVHILSVRKKALFFDLLGIHSHVDRFLVYSTWQQRYIRERWRVPEERVIWTPFQADARFWTPEACPEAGPGEPPTILSVGREFRDYPTLMEAVEGLDVRLHIASGSPWSRRADTTAQRPIPPNVTVGRLSMADLRRAYARARFVVVPLYNVDFQAGVTTILEAMAMGKAVIVSRTPGQRDVVIEGETGIYVPPEDPPALRSAIEHLLADPAAAERMGANGRRLLCENMSLDAYVQRLTHIMDHTR